MLKSSDTNKLRSAVLRNVPPRTFSVARGVTTFATKGYLKLAQSPANLDALGFHEMDATVYLSEGALLAGDEIDGTFVVWGPHRDDTFTSYVLRRIPGFIQWSLHGLADGGTDTTTGEPILTPSDTPFDIAITRYIPAVKDDLSGTNAQSKAIGVTRAGVLSQGDDVSHPDYGSFSVVSIIPYGPYERVELGGG